MLVVVKDMPVSNHLSSTSLTKRPPNWFASGGMDHAARAADGSGDATQPAIGQDSATGRFT